MMRILLATSFLVLVSCATSEKPPTFSLNSIEDQEDNSIDDSLVWAQKRAVDRIHARISDGPVVTAVHEEEAEPIGAKDVAHKYELNTKDDHPSVQKWIKYYSEKDRVRFQRFLNRGAKYKRVVQDLLVSNGLPPDLYYLGILESGYVTKAISRAGAVGPWQFMAPTGRQYGLKINNYVDERQDPIRSTLAAVRYLKELYRVKKTWYLALASYNAGPGRVRRAMRRGGVRNYWKLTRRRLLPYDTREYIPQFLAILIIGKDLEKYNFEEKAESQLEPMELVKVPSPVKFDKIAAVSGLNLSKLKKLNPHLHKGMTPPGKKSHYHIWVPKKDINNVAMAYDRISSHRLKGLRVQRSIASRSRTRYHNVRRGQNLSFIARRYGTSVSKIKRINNMRSSRIMVGQRLKIRGSVAKQSRVAYKKIHRVRRGENLTLIAKKYGVSVNDLKKMNRLKNGHIFVGQKISLVGKTSTSTKVKRYKIRRGDNLSIIARKFGISIKQIKRINNLSGNRIMRGQYLKVAGN